MNENSCASMTKTLDAKIFCDVLSSYLRLYSAVANASTSLKKREFKDRVLLHYAHAEMQWPRTIYLVRSMHGRQCRRQYRATASVQRGIQAGYSMPAKSGADLNGFARKGLGFT